MKKYSKRMMLTALMGTSSIYFAQAQSSVDPGSGCLFSSFQKLSDNPILCQGDGAGCTEIVCP